MNVELVPASQSPSGTETALSWALELWGDHIPNYSRQDWVNFYRNAIDANYESWIGEKQELVYIALHDHEIVGTISLVDFDELEEYRHLTPWIAAFIVDPERKGTGIGSKMLASIEEKAQLLGISSLHLWTEDQADFYRKRGYEFVTSGELGKLRFDIFKKDLIN